MFNKREIEYILENANADCSKLLLGGAKEPGIRVKECVAAILARRKLRDKVPLLYNHPAIEYPISLSVEQCSSQETALYKSSIVKGILESAQEKRSTADITGGMGIDSLFIAGALGQRHLYIERNPLLCSAARENFALLGAKSIEVLMGDCMEMLPQLQEAAPLLIYADPARRASGSGGKLILLKDYEPDILSLKAQLLQIAPYLLVKVSPMADIRLNLELMPECTQVHIVALENECKELLFLLEREPAPQCTLHAVNIRAREGSRTEFTFTLAEEKSALCRLATGEESAAYLFEPNRAILKSGAFKTVAQRLNLTKLAPSTHLYFTDEQSAAPFGRLFPILSVRAFSKEALKHLRKEFPKANVIARNFPISTEEVRKRAKIEDGGEVTLFFTTLNNGCRSIIICKGEPLYKG